MSTVPAQQAVDADLVRALLQRQHPRLAHHPLKAVGDGWVNYVFRLGQDLVIRLPRRESVAGLMAKEQRWLPELTAELETATSVPLYVGVPEASFPYPWSVSEWFDGLDVSLQPRDRNVALAGPLGSFLNAFHREAPADYPANPMAGGTLASRSQTVQERLRSGMVPHAARIAEIWEQSAELPPWNGEPLWLHGDLHPANLIAKDGTLQAVIDFGDLTAGDPATDLASAWLVFDAAGRRCLRRALGDRYDGDPFVWLRARGWAVYMASNLLAGADRHPGLNLVGSETLIEILTDDLTWL